VTAIHCCCCFWLGRMRPATATARTCAAASEYQVCAEHTEILEHAADVAAAVWAVRGGMRKAGGMTAPDGREGADK
jgi:hypothetical protein